MSQEILILERATDNLVPAVFHEKVSIGQLLEAESQWGPFRMAARQRLLSKGKTENEIACELLQHAHWSWALKSRCLEGNPLALRCYGIELKREWQGLELLDVSSHVARLEPDKGKPLVYVEFLESAPWNVQGMIDEPRYGLVGRRLVEAAVRLSISRGLKGRLGLYALPQAEGFYRKCGMACIKGAAYHNMNLFELAPDAASAFIEGGQK